MSRPRSGRPFEYETELWLPQGREEVFAFFADARNLNRLTPDWLRFDIRSPQPIEMKLGTKIDYRFRWRLLPLPWTSEIVEWRPPELFTYEQRRGPYRLWRHEHRYEADNGGTRVIDRVEWRALGDRWLHRAIARDVERIFEHRNRAAVEIVSSPLQ